MLLPQVYAFNVRTSKVEFTDDLIFSADKKGLFQLVVLPNDIREVESLARGVDDIDNIPGDLLLVEEAVFLVQSTKSSIPAKDVSIHQELARIATGDEFGADTLLCKNRPPPVGYDEMRLHKEVGGKKYVIVRPDRFVFAACDTLVELKEAVSKLRSSLHLQ